jgi:hypothetical protein
MLQAIVVDADVVPAVTAWQPSRFTTSPSGWGCVPVALHLLRVQAPPVLAAMAAFGPAGSQPHVRRRGAVTASILPTGDLPDDQEHRFACG